MPKKRNVKKILIIALILFIVILAVRELVIEAIERANAEDKIYTSVSDFESIKEIAEYMGCTYIKQEKTAGEKYDIDIYLKFKYPLYTEEVSNEEYYYKMIALMIGYLDYQNMRLIDEENDIVIAVTCDKEKKEISDLLINGQSNYFGTQETLKSIEKYQVLNISEIEVQAEEIKELIEKDWIAKEVNFGTKESTFNKYDIYFDEGIEVKIINKKIFNIVFTEKYNKAVVNGIKVNTSFDEIKQILGEPIFSHENYIENNQKDIGYIGYKGKDIYVFFSENEISIYRTEEANTSTELADLIETFNQDGDFKKFVSAVTDMWTDYNEYRYSSNFVQLKYSLRGIAINYNVNEQSGVTVYNNYNGYINKENSIKEVINDISLLPANTYLKLEDDAVDINEGERKNQYNIMYENTIIGEPNIITEEFNIFIAEQKEQEITLKFISKNRKYVNFEETFETTNLWKYNETQFIYSIPNKGIYLFDLTTREHTALIEGEAEYSIKGIENNQVLYDDTILFIDAVM